MPYFYYRTFLTGYLRLILECPQFYFMMNMNYRASLRPATKRHLLICLNYMAGPYLNLLKLPKTEQAAEEILRNIFLIVWQKRETITINLSTKGYLFSLAENKVHDFFGKLKRHRELYHQEVS